MKLRIHVNRRTPETGRQRREKRATGRGVTIVSGKSKSVKWGKISVLHHEVAPNCVPQLSRPANVPLAVISTATYQKLHHPDARTESSQRATVKMTNRKNHARATKSSLVRPRAARTFKRAVRS
ncbi:hypothetical protein L484_010079 [Morus notabilis]|uniref:Uncharacterized protein n=1 Tax=Morus notabilis TaxID=981085 RepID=W9RMM2_9ROSA|nr:hypothetical protein L484_010079 [Morus notabilis]